MKEYSLNFFFPNQPGARQEITIREEASNVGTALHRAWRTLKSHPKYKGRKGLETFRVGVTVIREVKNVESEAGADQEG